MDAQRYVDGLEDIAYDVLDVRFLGPKDLPYSIIAV
jgi:aminoglycoside phosphotransferase family enzyme